MKRVEDPELFDAQSTNGHVTLYDGRGHVLGYVDPVTRIQTDTHGRAVARCPRSDALPIAAETLAGHVPRTGSPVGGGERDLAQSLAVALGVAVAVPVGAGVAVGPTPTVADTSSEGRLSTVAVL